MTAKPRSPTKARVEAVADTPPLEDLSYEQARDELVKVVNLLEQGGASLEESLALWERGEALARRCEEWLIGAKARLDAARVSSTGPDTGAS
ncbi:MAG: exodeoxyribonuclease VII small subunit [Pseudolysinimonas sp.]